MAFGAKSINPLDTKPGTAIGVAIPFNSPSVFKQTFFSKDAIRNNILNYFLTNKNERYLNVGFGADLRSFIFEQITSDNTEYLKEDIQSKLNSYFPNILINELNIFQSPDENKITMDLKYSIKNTGINDKIEITFQ